MSGPPEKVVPTPDPVEEIQTSKKPAIISSVRGKSSTKSAIFDDDSDDQDDLFSTKPKAPPTKSAPPTASISKTEPAPMPIKTEAKSKAKATPASIFDDEEDEDDDLFAVKKPVPTKSTAESRIEGKPVENTSQTSLQAPEKGKLPGSSTSVLPSPPPVQKGKISEDDRDEEEESKSAKSATVIPPVMETIPKKMSFTSHGDEDENGEDLFAKKPVLQRSGQSDPATAVASTAFASDVVDALGTEKKLLIHHFSVS